MVPAKDVDRYNAALLEFDAMPTDLGSQMLSKLESMGPFSTDKQRQDLKEAMLLKEMRRMLRAVPDIEDASVVVASSHRRPTWSQKTKVTATVSVKPRGGRELSPKLVHAIRSAVASMVPDLQPADVTVLDRINSKSHTGDDANDPLDGKLMRRIQEFTQHYEQKIRNDLHYIPDVGVTVQVDVENVKSSVIKSQTVDPKKTTPLATVEKTNSDNLQQRMPRGEAGVRAMRPSKLQEDHTAGPDRTRQQTESETNTVFGVSYEQTEKALIAAMPKAVQVSVSIPRSYYREVVDQRKADGEADGAKTDVAAVEKVVMADVQKSVEKLVPSGSKDAVVVKTVDLVERPVAEPKVPWMELVRNWLQDWAGAVGLAMFAAWVLWTLRKMSPAVPAASSLETDPFDAKRLQLQSSLQNEADAQDRPKEPNRRELIQSIVKDNPEMTASVIGKWLQAAK
jgi:flagellar M-ring protein FliF